MAAKKGSGSALTLEGDGRKIYVVAEKSGMRMFEIAVKSINSINMDDDPLGLMEFSISAYGKVYDHEDHPNTLTSG